MENTMESKMKAKPRKTISKNKKKIQDSKKNFKKLLMTEKDSLNKSLKNFFHSPRIKVGQR